MAPPARAGEHTVTLQQDQEVYGQTYTGTEDSHIYSYSSAADTNYGRRPEAKTGGNDKKRLLTQFKIFASEGGPVPDGATVNSATLKIYKISGNDYGPYNVYRVLKAWKETEVTWNSAATGDAWNTPGCEGAGTDRTTDPVATPSVSSGWMDVDITSCVQAFAGGTATNNGWLLVDTYGNYRTWATRDYQTDTSLRPKLEITYTGNTDPVAKAYALPQKGVAPFAVTFDASASEDVDGTIVSFSWSFGDGSDPEEGSRVEHTYSTADTYTATLTITDDEGGVDTKEFTITAFDLNEVYTVTYQEGQDVGGNPYDGTRDASMYSYHPDSNYDSSSETFRSGGSDHFRPIISFEVFDSEGGVIPAGSEVVSATLYLSSFPKCLPV